MTTADKRDTTDIDFATFVSFIIEKKWLIIAISLSVCLLSMLYIFTRPTKYQANLLLQIQLKKPAMSGNLAKMNQLSEVQFSPEESVASQIGLMRSRFILGPVIQNLGLDINVPHSFISSLKNMLNTIHAPIGAKPAVIKKPETDVIKKLLGNLNITELGNSSENNANKITILNISLVGDNPALIERILNEIALVSQQKNIERKRLHTDQLLNFLNKQLLIAKQSLQIAETNLNQYRHTNNKHDIQLESHYLMSRLTNLDKEIHDLDVEKSTLLQKYTVHYPLVKEIYDKIVEVKNQRHHVYNELKRLPASDQIVSTLNRDIQVKKELYLSLLNQIHELQVVKAGIVSDIHVLLTPSHPDIYMPVNISLIGIVSLLAGFLIGILFVFIKKVIPIHRF